MAFKKILLFLILLTVLSDCGQLVPSTTPTNEPTATAIASSTPQPSRTPYPSRTPIPTATEWIKVYPTKRPLLIYGTYWRNEYTIQFIEWGDFYPEPYLILYEDGQLIFTNSLLEKQLSPEETNQVISKIKQLGFFELQNIYERDANLLFAPETDRGFDPTSPQIFITVNEKDPKSIYYQKYREDYLIQPMKDVLAYLNSFSPEGATPYEPDRLLVAIAGEDVKYIPEDATIIPWPEDVIAPSHRSWMGVLYLEETDALKLYKAARESLMEYFSFEGKNYAVYLRPILPHECHIYHFYELETFPEEAQTPFICDGW